MKIDMNNELNLPPVLLSSRNPRGHAKNTASSNYKQKQAFELAVDGTIRLNQPQLNPNLSPAAKSSLTPRPTLGPLRNANVSQIAAQQMSNSIVTGANYQSVKNTSLLKNSPPSKTEVLQVQPSPMASNQNQVMT